MRAVNDQGDGDGSNRFRHARYRAPGADPECNAGYRQITLTWTAPTDDGGADVTGYRIEIFRNGAYALRTPARLPPPATPTPG